MSYDKFESRKDIIIELHSVGLNNKQIAKKMKITESTVVRYLKRLKLGTNGPKGKTLIVNGNLGKCSKCQRWLTLDCFDVMRRGRKDEYRMSYCRDCRRKKYDSLCNSNIKSFWKRRFTNWRKGARQKNILWDLDMEYLKKIYDKQNGKCFYTDEELSMKMSKGEVSNCLSLDKIIPEKGYIRGNVVFCTRRFNTIKNNITLEEMKEWMAPIYERLVDAGYVK